MNDNLQCEPEKPIVRKSLSGSIPHSIIPESSAPTPVGTQPAVSTTGTSNGTASNVVGTGVPGSIARPGVGSRQLSFESGSDVSASSAPTSNTAEEFFFKNNRRSRTNAGTPDSLHTIHDNNVLDIHNTPSSSITGSGTTNSPAISSQLHFIQPKPRVVHHPKSTVIDKRKEDDLGLPSLRINRSSSNLASLNASAANSSTNLLAMAGTQSLGLQLSGGRGSFSIASKRSGGFFLNNSNLSSSSLQEHPEHDVSFEGGETVKEIDADDWSNNYNDMIHGRAASKLAPYGGFSNPDIENELLTGENIFDTAPWKVVFADKGNVSLTKAVKMAFDAGIIHDRKWVGTIAMPSDSVSTKVLEDIGKTLSKDYNSDAVFADDETFQGHYQSFCKQILWPTLHYQIPDDPKSKAFEDHLWDQYKLLNQIIADKAVEVYLRENKDLDPNDSQNMIWVHDYHLLLVPKMIRDKLPNAKIGFFLHVSFPSLEIFRVFAERKELLQGMLGANCILMQTDEYVRHFMQTCLRLLLADTNEMGISYNGRYTIVNTIPVGIDVPLLKDSLCGEEVLEWRQMIRERWGGQKLLVLRDKLDRLRGIKQRLLAYEKLLLTHPEYVDNTVLIQICIGSVQDSDYEAEIMQIVSRINSLAENISVNQPVIFLQQDIDFEQYLALQCELEVFVVSSMREGLNLTCHEFIVATLEKKSPLVLSEFTGSSPLLECGGRGALMINPWDVKNFSEMLQKLLVMSPEEKEERWKNCYDIVLEHDSKNWVKNCLKSINDGWEYDQRRSSNNIQPFVSSVLEDFYRAGNGKSRLILLNLETPLAILAIYDTSSTSGKTPAAGKTDSFSEPSRITSLLNDLLLDPLNNVYLISFLKRSDLDILYRTNPKLGLIAENGGYIKLIGSKTWISLGDEQELKSWMPQVAKLIESKVVRLPGSHIEVEDCTIRFHPGRAFLEDHDRSLDVMGDCIQHINDVFQELEGIHATLIRNVVIVQQNQLTLKALQFVLSYYNSTMDKFEYSFKRMSSLKMRNSTSHSSISSINSNSLNNNSDKHIDSLFIAGGSTLIDEPGFEYAIALKDSGEIPNVLTVAVLGSDANVRTSAAYGVLGKNVLLSILSKVEE